MFFSKEEYFSLKNGVITVNNFLFSSSVVVNTCLQSGPYIQSMWKNAFKKIPKEGNPKKVLLLGLGGGDVIRILQKKYQHIFITVVEWDEVMITIAKSLGVASSQHVQIIQGDALSVLPVIEKSFDIIIVDLFTGDLPPIFLTEQKVLRILQKRLTSQGLLFVNFFRHEKYVDAFRDYFKEEQVWKFKYNTLAFFSGQVN